MSRRSRKLLTQKLLFASCFAALVPSLSASQLILNGGFETGNFTNWVVTNSSGDGTFSVATAPVTPLTGNPTVGPSSGTYYAVSDQYGPGSYAITQTFTVPAGSLSSILSFNVFVNDEYDLGGSFGEVDLLAGNANRLTGTPLAIFYRADTFVVNGRPNPYVAFSMDINSLLVAGSTYQLRAIDSDTNPLNVGVDNFSLLTSTAVPEPVTFAPFLLGAAFFAFRKRRI